MSCSCSNGGACASSSANAAPEESAHDNGCSGGEPVALQVLGDSMAPEFRHGEIIIVEPDGAVVPGSYVLVSVNEDWQLRQLDRDAEGWLVRYFQPAPGQDLVHRLADLSTVWGVVIQKSIPGRRRERKLYGGLPT